MGRGAKTDNIARAAYWGGLSWGMFVTTACTVYSLAFLHFEMPSRPITMFILSGQDSTVPPLYDPYVAAPYIVLYLLFCVITLSTVVGAALNKPYRYSAFTAFAGIHAIWHSLMSPTALFSLHFFGITAACVYGFLYASEN